ncbi:MAG TPA: D-alanyl-D-alanine carboxypeptidase, partial [Solirubrobacterales bacterium]
MRRGGILLAVMTAVAAMLLLPAAATARGGGEAGRCRQLKERLVRGGGQASGLYVLDATSGRAVCARAAGRQRPLASNMKLFTTSTALTRFGPEYRIETKLLSDGALDGEGVLHGNLYLQGGGDPALGVPAF